jgi:hypothetical protein
MTKNNNEEQLEEYNYINSLTKMDKNELTTEALSQRDKVLELQKEIDMMKFVLDDASADLISVSKAQYLIQEDRKKQVQYINKCIDNNEPYLG